jgi:Flp pilus assembly protein TadD
MAAALHSDRTRMTTPAAPGSALSFSPGFVLARRYRLVEQIGRARVGDVWRAIDLVLLIPIAVKITHPPDEHAREQILKSFRIARQITHPAVRRVFDVGQSEGAVFCTMEFIPGEDLATLVRRAGRLPVETVAAIGRQLCQGLEAAHAQGLVHGNLQPVNVLIDDAGTARITDFESLTYAEVEPSEYMAPEQRGPDHAASERGDLFSLGVILYELLVGHRPAAGDGRGVPPRPSALVRDVDPALDAVITRAISVDPSQRPASAAEMGASLGVVTAPARRRPRAKWLAASALAAVIAGLAAAAWSLLPRGAALTAQDTLVLADVVNTTGDPVFDGTLKVALAVALEQTPFLRVFPDERVRDTLRLMQRPGDTPVTRDVAREIARRERLKAVVAGSIQSLGNTYIIALEVIDAETGATMARQQLDVREKEQVLSAIGTAATSLRERLGESLTSVQQFDVPLPRATTASLEALHAYALALDEGRLLPRVEAIPHLRRAIELDPDFAMAHALLSGAYANTGSFREAPAHSRRAFELRDRVSERERFFLSWRYYIDAEQAWDEALTLARSWTATYPREAFAFNSLGLALAAFGEHAEAVPAFREAIRLDYRFVPPHGNLIGSLIALGRFDDARTPLAEARQRRLTVVTERRMSYTLALLSGDAAAMNRQVELLRGTPDEMFALIWEGRTAASTGRFADAHDLFRRGAAAAAERNLPALASQWISEDAEAHAIAGQCDDAGREALEGVRLSRDNFTLERAGRALALCGDAAEAARLSSELSRQFPRATLTTRVHRPVIAAIIELQQGRAREALRLLDPVRPYDHAPAAEFWPSYLRGQAHLAAGDATLAAGQFQHILDHRSEAPASPFYSLAHLGAARAAVAAGDLPAGRKAYDAFLAQWAGADKGLALIAGAGAESRRLR